ncbi:hypothetical protein ACHAXA_001897 [Cyclostephanos tholiformis]|uniref:Uncharacterized protein n=1 Tax=Cyclostephanos tholiformis TaxID=382380 RepID=A0ABD3R520_9STRA
MASVVKEKIAKVQVLCKKPHDISELLARGPEEESTTKSAKSKAIWMTFLIVMFYISLEIFNRMFGVTRASLGDKSGL